jgi:hypothetical protein
VQGEKGEDAVLADWNGRTEEIDSFKRSGGEADTTGQGESLRPLRQVIDAVAPPGRAEPARASMGDAIMNRWWTGVALLAVGLLPGTAWCQPGDKGVMPSPIGAARIPDPTRPYCGPELVPGPVTAEIAPQGPDCNLSLPADHTSAFQCETYPLENAWWFNIGTQMLIRNGYGHLPLFYFDNTPNLNVPTDRFGNPIAAPISNVGLDKGTVPGRLNGPPFFLLDGNDLDRNPMYGLRASFGYIIDGSSSFEATGWYMPQRSITRGVINQGRLNSFFFNPPLGFEGDNGMWLQADVANLIRRTTIGSGELNYRHTSGGVTEPDLILGIRYLDLHEHYNLYTGDDDLTFLAPVGPNAGFPDPHRQATLDWATYNRIVAPQLGFEWTPLNFPINRPIVCAGMWAKGAWGANFIDFDNRLVRGDGFVGFHSTSSKVTFSQIYEAGLFADIAFLERFRFRAGYQAMWFLGIADAQDQVDFNLAHPQGRQKDNGSQFWHGPMAEFQFLF